VQGQNIGNTASILPSKTQVEYRNTWLILLDHQESLPNRTRRFDCPRARAKGGVLQHELDDRFIFDQQNTIARKST
jgi:hypothetical protein